MFFLHVCVLLLQFQNENVPVNEKDEDESNELSKGIAGFDLGTQKVENAQQVM